MDFVQSSAMRRLEKGNLVDVKTFLNWATAQGYNTSTAYKGFTGKFKDEAKTAHLMTTLLSIKRNSFRL